MQSRDCTPSTISIASDSRAIAFSREIDALLSEVSERCDAGCDNVRSGGDSSQPSEAMIWRANVRHVAAAAMSSAVSAGG